MSPYPGVGAATEHEPRSGPVPVKIVVAGGFGVGKSTFVSTISDIAPLSTEAELTDVGRSVDDPAPGTAKHATTVALDFGRVRLGTGLMLYLFGAPGQARFRFMWNELLGGSIGAVVLVDTSRLADSFDAVDHLEQVGVPFLVAINAFHGALRHHPSDVRHALALDPSVPLVVTDARHRSAVRDTLISLVRHTIDLWTQDSPLQPIGVTRATA